MSKVKAWYADTPDLEMCKQEQKISILVDSLEWLKNNMSIRSQYGISEEDVDINIEHINDTLKEVSQIK